MCLQCFADTGKVVELMFKSVLKHMDIHDEVTKDQVKVWNCVRDGWPQKKEGGVAGKTFKREWRAFQAGGKDQAEPPGTDVAEQGFGIGESERCAPCGEEQKMWCNGCDTAITANSDFALVYHFCTSKQHKHENLTNIRYDNS